jgi:hypothetical protein
MLGSENAHFKSGGGIPQLMEGIVRALDCPPQVKDAANATPDAKEKMPTLNLEKNTLGEAPAPSLTPDTKAKGDEGPSK